MENRNIEQKDLFKCTGCEACKNACPKNAISIVLEKNGYKYPRIDHSLCINCGLCFQSCKIDCYNEQKVIYSNCFLFHSTNSKKSSSGGFGFNLGTSFLNEVENSVLYSAIFDENLQGKYIRIDQNNISDLNRVAGSKYVKCELIDTFKQIEKDLADSRVVLVIGLPCDILGIQSFIKIKKIPCPNIYYASLFCGGVISSSYFDCYISFLNRGKKNVNEINFRDKKWNPVAYCTSIYDTFGKKRILNGMKNSYINIMGSAYIRPSCLGCNLTRTLQSDYSFGDCHFPSIKDTTLVFSSKRGYELVKQFGFTEFINIIEPSEGLKRVIIRQPLSDINYLEIIKKQELFFNEMTRNYKKAIKKNIIKNFSLKKKLYFYLPYFFKRTYAKKRILQ